MTWKSFNPTLRILAGAVFFIVLAATAGIPGPSETPEAEASDQTAARIQGEEGAPLSPAEAALKSGWFGVSVWQMQTSDRLAGPAYCPEGE